MTESKLNIELANVIYFIGIGGIGMSALARYFHAKGKKVSGYDRTETALTISLQENGIEVYYDENLDDAPKNADLVIYTPAIPKDNALLVFYQTNGYTVIKRSEALESITETAFNICVAGTHGKTTTTTMIAHLLSHSGYGCNAFLGGISANYNTNFWSHSNNVCVIEADEYDRSFLKLHPDIAVITAIDADHLDIYGTEENVRAAYYEFSGKIKANGLLVKKFGLGKELKASEMLTYSLQNESANSYASNVQLKDGGYIFDVMLRDEVITDVHLNMGGMHNVENMIAAITVANYLNIDNGKIKEAVEDFKGVKRRFEYMIKTKELVVIDDYAHHPEELRALIRGVRSLFGQKRITIVFQPHLYSRTKDFAKEFAAVLDEADRVILLPVYPARELPIPGVDSSLILNKMQSEYKNEMSKEALLNWVKNDFALHREKEFGEVIVFAGAGDIDQLVNPIKTILEETL